MDGTAPVLEPFTQAVPGTIATLRLLPVPAGVDGDAPIGPFWMSRAEVTWDLFDAFLYGLDEPAAGEDAPDAVARPSKPYISMDRGFGHAGYPAISMSYRSAEAFCRWLSSKTGRRYRLPTEAEWEHACRLGAIDPADLDEHAWHRGNAEFKTHPVAALRPDRLGVCDLYGNAAEWCTGRDGEPLVAGGSYRDVPGAVGCGARQRPQASWNASDPQLPKSVWWLADAGFVGFRVVCEPPPANGDEP